MSEDKKRFTRELSELYGSAWFYASYYLLFKSESRVENDEINYFYVGGKEAEYLYNMIGWDFLNKDTQAKAWFERERSRCIQAGNREGYDDLLKSEELYEKEKELAVKASRLGRFMGEEKFHETLKNFLMTEEKTPWFIQHNEISLEEDVKLRVLSNRLLVNEKDVRPLSELNKESFILVSFDIESETEPARFIGKVQEDNKTFYYIEHLREFGNAWGGSGKILENIWDNASHDGCLEIVSISEDEADDFFIGLNGPGSFTRGRLEARCALSDLSRKIKARIFKQPFSFYKGKPIVPLKKVLQRYRLRKERLVPLRIVKEEQDLPNIRKQILAERQVASETIRSLGDTNIERMDALLATEVRRQREEVMEAYRRLGRKSRRDSSDSGKNRSPERLTRIPERNVMREKDDSRNRKQEL